jgi:hypothetical protein
MWVTEKSDGTPYVADGGSNRPSGEDLSQLHGNFFASTTVPYDVTTYAYDAAVSLGIAACAYEADGGTFDSDFDASALFNKLINTSFDSISGSVAYIGKGGECKDKEWNATEEN